MLNGLRYAGLVIVLLWLLEMAAIACGSLVALDATLPSDTSSWLLLEVARGWNRYGLLAGLALFGCAMHVSVPPSTEELISRGTPFLRGQRWTALAIFGFALAAAGCLMGPFWAATITMFMRLAGASFGGIGIVVATLAMVRALRQLPSRIVWATTVILAASAAATALARAVYDRPPAFLQHATLIAVNAVIRQLYPNAVRDLDLNAVGTAVFRVRVFPACSGVEGMTLGLLFVAQYLYLCRRTLHFPRALLLAPLVVLTLGLANVARIVLFIAVGQHASRQAVDAFHSSIGWVMFAATIACAIPIFERVLRLRVALRDEATRSSGKNDAAPFLMPFIVSLLFASVLSMLLLDASKLALLRYAVAVVVLSWSLQHVHAVRLPTHAGPWLAGAAVAAVYVLTSPPNAAPSSLIAATFGGSSLTWAALHFFGFAIVTPLVEELAFRAYLMRRLVSGSFLDVPYHSVGYPEILISAVAFGAMHDLWMQATIAGVVFGLSARFSGGVGGALASHAVANGTLAVYAVATGRLGVIA
jgi:exosortase E/protease (VPEID-CTERM system)